MIPPATPRAAPPARVLPLGIFVVPRHFFGVVFHDQVHPGAPPAPASCSNHPSLRDPRESPLGPCPPAAPCSGVPGTPPQSRPSSTRPLLILAGQTGGHCTGWARGGAKPRARRGGRGNSGSWEKLEGFISTEKHDHCCGRHRAVKQSCCPAAPATLR